MACRSRSVDLASPGVAEDDPGQRQPEEGDPAHGLPGAYHRTVAERGPRPRVQEVDRDLRRVEVPQLEEELDPLGVGLAHADERSAAQLHPVRRTSRQVSARSSQEWVVTTSPKYDRAVSRLWL